MQEKKRLGIYVYWDEKGVAKQYALYYVKHLFEICQDVIVVVNGRLSSEGVKSFELLKAKILFRSNEGYDFAAWREGILQVGWDKILNYDEVILCNSSCYGPVGGSFQPMFDKMECVKSDFWGISFYPENGPELKQHIQSYFLVFRKTIIISCEFKNYWERIPVFKNWLEAVTQGEVPLTKFFEDKGFLCHSLIPLSLYAGKCHDATLLFPTLLMKNGSVLVKKKVFSREYDEVYRASNGDIELDAIRFLKEKKYPLEFIFEDLNKNLPPSSIRQNLHQIKYPELEVASHVSTKKIGLIFHVYFEDLIDDCINYICSFPRDSLVLIVSSKMKLLDSYQRKVELLGFENIEFRLQKNRGRNEAAFFITGKDVWSKVDYICLAHDKKSPSMDPPVSGNFFMKHCLMNLLKDRNYVLGVVSVFLKNPEIGLLEPPPPLFGPYSNLQKDLWAGNELIAQDFMKRIKKEYVWDPNPIAPFGGMMWVRTKAFEPLIELNLKIEDFPEEPLMANCTLLHALERLYPSITQASGFLTAWIMTNDYSAILIDNLYHKVGMLQKELNKNVVEENIRKKYSFYSKVKKIFRYPKKKKN